MEKQTHQAKMIIGEPPSLTGIHDIQMGASKDPGVKRKLKIVCYVLLPSCLLALVAKEVLKSVQESLDYELALLHENSGSQEGRKTIVDGILNAIQLLIALQLVIFFLSRISLLFLVVDTAYSFIETYIGEEMNMKQLLLRISKIRERPLITCLHIIFLLFVLIIFVGILIGVILGIAEGVSSIISLKVIN